MALLDVKGLTKRFGGITAVDGCSFAVAPGVIQALIGPNGAGKTTVFNMLSGHVRPDRGEILFDGVPVTRLKPHQITRRGLSWTFQITRMLGELTVLEAMAAHVPTQGWTDLARPAVGPQEREKAMELLEFVGIAHLKDEQSRNLSYGQQKLLEFAAAFMANPRLVLLDEPAGGVNPRMIDRLCERIETMNRRHGVTFLIIEHTMDMIMTLCNPIVVMAEGKHLATGSPAEIQSDPRVLEAYLGGAA